MYVLLSNFLNNKKQVGDTCTDWDVQAVAEKSATGEINVALYSLYPAHRLSNGENGFLAFIFPAEKDNKWSPELLTWTIESLFASYEGGE